MQTCSDVNDDGVGMFLECNGMAKSIIVLISSSLDQQIVDSVVHLTLLQWKSNCKILYRICLISFIFIIP